MHMIYLIITTCINNRFGIQDSEHRKNRYIECIQSVLNIVKDDDSIKPIIVENNGVRSTFLDDFDCDVVYTYNNNVALYHKGMNELLDIKEVIQKYDIQDDDVIIKLTGRYKILSPVFFDVVKANCHTYDSFVKFFNVCTLQYMYDDCVLGLFAIKCKYLKPYECSEHIPRSMECQFADYVRANVSNVMEIRDLGMECCFADSFETCVV